MGRKKSQGKDIKLIPCACGCGNLLPNFDKQGRPRKYLLGHNARRFTSPHHFGNPLIKCACGCGGERPLYGKKGVERKYIKGHQGRKIGNLQIIQEAIRKEGSPAQAECVLGLSKESIISLLKRNQINYFTDLTKVGGKTAFGRKAELDALKLLPSSIDATCNDPHKSPFDLIWHDKRINVKASTIKDSGRGLRWAFGTRQSGECDYYLCIGYDKDAPQFALLIPAREAPTCLSFPISYNSKWAKYSLPQETISKII